jgi:hypothetical protein
MVIQTPFSTAVEFRYLGTGVGDRTAPIIGDPGSAVKGRFALNHYYVVELLQLYYYSTVL